MPRSWKATAPSRFRCPERLPAQRASPGGSKLDLFYLFSTWVDPYSVYDSVECVLSVTVHDRIWPFSFFFFSSHYSTRSFPTDNGFFHIFFLGGTTSNGGLETGVYGRTIAKCIGFGIRGVLVEGYLGIVPTWVLGFFRLIASPPSFSFFTSLPSFYSPLLHLSNSIGVTSWVHKGGADTILFIY